MTLGKNAALLGGSPPDLSEPVRKCDFAVLAGVSQARVSQYIAAGMPIEANGRVIPAVALNWIDEHHPRRSSRDSGASAPTATLQALRAEREGETVRHLRLEYERKAGRLIDRDAAERAIFARARLERDAWRAWVTRAAPLLASEFSVDERAVLQVLDTLVRQHLEELADTPLTVLDHGRDN